jgi:hypothetical protein
MARTKPDRQDVVDADGGTGQTLLVAGLILVFLVAIAALLYLLLAG